MPVIELTAPVEAVELMVIEPPRDTDPPPDKPDPVLIVIEELLRAEVGMFVIVLSDPEMLLLVSV